MEENKDKLSESQQKKIEEINKETDTLRKIEEELKANKPAQEYLQKFSESSVKSFISSYLFYKSMWHSSGERNLQRKSGQDLEWMDTAQEHLVAIQQKKLFDLQCLWRAEKIQLPGVEICIDFDLYAADILNCPFLDPVTEEDIGMYKDYLETENADLFDNYFGSHIEWQNYEEIIEGLHTEDEGLDLPEWYEYHNTRTGNGSYMLLPNIRGEKEDFYRDLSRSNDPARNGEHHEAKKNADPARDNRPYISFYEDADYFVKNFEDKLTVQYYKAFKWSTRNMDELEEYNNMLEYLMEADEEVEMVAHPNWRDGLRRTVAIYKARKIKEALSEVFSQYQLNLSMGIGFPPNDKAYTEFKDIIMKDILNGRRLNGEPEDLNF